MSAAARNHAAASSCCLTPTSGAPLCEPACPPRPRPRLNLAITRPCPSASPTCSPRASSRPTSPKRSVRSSAPTTTTDAASGCSTLSIGTLPLGSTSSADVFRRRRLEPGDGSTDAGLVPTAASSAETLRRNRRELGEANAATGLASSAPSVLRFPRDAGGDTAPHGSVTDAVVADVFRLSLLKCGDIAEPAVSACVGVDAIPLSGSGGASCTGAGTSQEVLRRRRRGLWQLAELDRAFGSAPRAATASSIPATALSAASAMVSWDLCKRPVVVETQESF